MRHAEIALAILAAAGVAAMAGLFLTWSNALMRGLDRADPAVAVPAMNAANEAIKNPLFGLIFAGTPLVLAGATSVTFLAGDRPAGILLACALLVYVVCILGVTAAINLPLNAELLASAPECSEHAWNAFAPRWIAANAVRTIGGFVSLGFALSALVAL
jgi:uncharacterized membrane protein